METTDQKYKYLFPYEWVPAGSKILIYGAGTLGQDYLQQIMITHYCNVVGMADRKYKDYPPMIVPLYSPEDIHTLQFDYVVVALRIAIGLNEVKRVLKEQGVQEDKIICVYERKARDISVFRENNTIEEKSAMALAFQKSDISVAILASGGLGDMVIQKRFLTELMKLLPDCQVDIYSIKAVEFLKYIYSDCRNINMVIPDLGSRYLSNCTRYALAMTIEACHFIFIDVFQKDVFMKKNPVFAEKICMLQTEIEKDDVDIKTPVHVTLIRRLYSGCNAYTGFNYNGVFSIADKMVNIPLDPAEKRHFDSLELGDYITVNYGNGECKDGSVIAKTWPLEFFEQVIDMFKKKYPMIKVIQLGTKDAPKMKGVHQCILGEDFRLVAHILKNTIFHLDIEGGLVHIASQLRTKCIVLFGPTVQKYYAYESNINISAGNCHNCWGIYTDINKCAKGMKKPECMYSITPGLVMENICKYMDKEMG